MDNLSNGFLSTVVSLMLQILMFPAMFKILQWHQFLVTSALIAFLELFCDSGCSVKNSTKVTMFYLMFGGAYVVGLDCQCV